MLSRPSLSQPDNSQSLRHYASMVHQALSTAIGIQPDQHRLNVETGYGWNFRHGSAVIEVYIHDNVDGTYFQVLSPIMHLPQSGLLPLYRRMLETNLQMTSAALGVYQDTVYVFTERPLDGLDMVEVESIISRVTAYADDLDNRLVAEFGGRLYARG